MIETKDQKVDNLEKEIDKLCDQMKETFYQLIYRLMSHRDYSMDIIKKQLQDGYDKIKSGQSSVSTLYCYYMFNSA